MITLIISFATPAQLNSAVTWTADNLHVPEEELTPSVAVGYVCKHYEAGVLTGWDGFIESIGG